MANVVVVGIQWGDEGKGKIVDLLCPAFDAVVRYQGGHNAGHTVKFGDRHFALRLIPSGILHPGKRCVMGNGMVVSPEAFFEEIEQLHAAGVDTLGRLFVSNRAHTLLPLHAALDQARERALGDSKIGTTARGIGPAYELKAARYGIRLGELAASGIDARLRVQLARLEPELRSLGCDSGILPARAEDECRTWAKRLEPYLADTEHLLHEMLSRGESLLFEGAQGALLDVDHGTYPFVTSSNPTAGGAATGSGVPPTALHGALGIVKAYTTRVGGGPFPGELDDAKGEYLRRRGNEFGTVTGRPRRCGWFDAVAVRYARRINGTELLALTKLDVLDELDEISVCVGYRIDGVETRDLPSRLDRLERAEPVLRTFGGWRSSTVGILDEKELPRAARDYIAFLENEVGAEVGLISTGPRREETILRDSSRLSNWTSGRLAKVFAERHAG